MFPLGITPRYTPHARFGLLQIGKAEIHVGDMAEKPKSVATPQEVDKYLKPYLQPVIDDLQRERVHTPYSVRLFPLLTYDDEQPRCTIGIRVDKMDLTPEFPRLRHVVYPESPRRIVDRAYLLDKLTTAIHKYREKQH